jgi:hypothetical protein
MTQSETERFIRDGTGPLDDLALTLPVFIGYHLGVVFLPMRNAADLLTRELVNLARNDLLTYSGITIAIGAIFASVLLVLGRRQSLHFQRFLWVGLEGISYAVAMRLVAGFVVGKLPLDAGVVATVAPSAFAGVVLSFGAGFYEELVFRVGIFGMGLRLLSVSFDASRGPRRLIAACVWAVIAGAAFSAWHYVGELGDVFELRSFVFRWVCGVVFTLIYVFRGFAPAVWTHALYDVWVLVL